jgi:hypothetical protein
MDLLSIAIGAQTHTGCRIPVWANTYLIWMKEAAIDEKLAHRQFQETISKALRNTPYFGSSTIN